MMRGVIFDIDHFAVHDGPGIRTVVYFKGCPLRCRWCHSPESQKLEPQVINVNGTEKVCGKFVTADEVVNEVISDKPFFDSTGGGITLSGGEVLFQPEFALDLLTKLKSNKIHTLIETSGMGRWEDLMNLSEYTDIFYYDIKTLDTELHHIYTGAGNELIIDNLTKLAQARNNKGIMIRVPLIPNHTDSEKNIADIHKFAEDIGIEIGRIELLPYNKSAAAKYEWLGIPYPLDEI